MIEFLKDALIVMAVITNIIFLIGVVWKGIWKGGLFWKIIEFFKEWEQLKSNVKTLNKRFKKLIYDLSKMKGIPIKPLEYFNNFSPKKITPLGRQTLKKHDVNSFITDNFTSLKQNIKSTEEYKILANVWNGYKMNSWEKIR